MELIIRIILILHCLFIYLMDAALAECVKGQLPCNDGSCIGFQFWCDSSQDCPDSSDEMYCIERFKHVPNPNRCKDDKYFVCKIGYCIPIAGYCDGYNSCHDNSDEENCGTTLIDTTQFERIGTVSNGTWHEATHVETTVDTVSNETWHEATHVETTVDTVSNGPWNETMFSNINLQTSTAVTNIILDSHMMKYNDSNELESTVRNIVYEDEKDSLNSMDFNIDDIDYTVNFKEIITSHFNQERKMAESCLFKIKDYKRNWGNEIAKASTALYLCTPDILKNDKNLISMKLHLAISSAFIRNTIESLSVLASYINALHAACDNPRNFYGFDLVDMLRKKTNEAQLSNESISPSIYLTLCIMKETTYSDFRNVYDMIANNTMHKIGMKALLALAATCIANIPEFSKYYLGVKATEAIFRMVTNLGLPNNVYDLALVAQAFNEAKFRQDLWNRSNVLKLMSEMQQPDGCFGDVISTYFALPVFCGKSIASLSKQCQPKEESGVSLEELMARKVEVLKTYSLYFGNPVKVAHSLKFPVGNSTLLQIMRIAEGINPLYRFKYNIYGKPSVYSIGEFVNDIENGLYWTLYVDSKTAGIVHLDVDIRTYVPNADEDIIFWLKPVF